MKWLKNLFSEKINEDPGISEIAIRAAEIQTRIAALRSSIERTEKSNKNTQASTQSMVAAEQPQVEPKTTSADALKAKLLGKKL